MARHTTDLTQFTRTLSTKIDATVRQKVKPILNKKMNANIRTNVYGAGTPQRYKRRKSKGGLEDNKYHKLEVEHMGVAANTINTTYIYYNDTPPAPFEGQHDFNTNQEFIHAIDKGNPNPSIGDNTSWWNKPRPFISIMPADTELKQQIADVITEELVSSSDNAVNKAVQQIFRKYDGKVMTIKYKF